jgi:hypothetical protein
MTITSPVLLTESGDIDHFIKAANKIVGGFEKRAV